MNKRLPFSPNETDAILYVIISVLLLISVNQVLSQPKILQDVSRAKTNFREEYKNSQVVNPTNLREEKTENGRICREGFACCSISSKISSMNNKLGTQVRIVDNTALRLSINKIIIISWTTLPATAPQVLPVVNADLARIKDLENFGYIVRC